MFPWEGKFHEGRGNGPYPSGSVRRSDRPRNPADRRARSRDAARGAALHPEAHRRGRHGTWDEGFFGPGSTGPQAYSATGNGGHVNGQGFTGIDATRGTLTNVHGRLWQAQVSGNITLPNLRIQVLPFRDDIGFNANGTQNSTPDGIDDRSCWTEARRGTYPR